MKKLVIAAAVAGTFAGCANTPVRENVTRTQENTKFDANKLAASGSEKKPIVLASLPYPYFGNKVSAQDDLQDELPVSLKATKKLHFSAKAMTAEEFARLITEETGIPVSLFKDSPSNQIYSNAGKPTTKTVDFSALPSMPVKALLDTASSLLGVDWDYYDGGIHLESTFRKNYQLSVSPFASKAKVTMSNDTQTSQGASGGGAGSPQSGKAQSTFEAVQTLELNRVESITKSLVAIAGDEKRVYVNPSIGTATVSCSKTCHRQVKDFVKTANTLMTAQVKLKVRVITIDEKDTGESGVDWNLVYSNITASGKGYGFALGTPQSIVNSVAGAIATNIFNPPNGTAGKFDGSRAIIKSLSELYQSTKEMPYESLVMSNETATIRAGSQQGYTAGTTVIPTGVSGTPVTAEQLGYASFGQVFHITPTVLPDGRVIIQLSINDTNLNNIESRPGGVDKLNTGETSTSSKFVLRSGSTLAITNFKNTSALAQDRGLFSGQSVGSKSANTKYFQTIVLVTPVIANV